MSELVWMAPTTCPACGGGNLATLEHCAGYRCNDCAAFSAEQPKAPHAFKVGDRVEVRHSIDHAWTAGTVSTVTRPGAAWVKRDDRGFDAYDSCYIRPAATQPAAKAERPYAGNAVCVHCGGPAHVSLVLVECMREGGCGVPVEAEPELISPNGGSLRHPRESCWYVEGDGIGALHPTREGAIAAWRAAVKEMAK